MTGFEMICTLCVFETDDFVPSISMKMSPMNQPVEMDLCPLRCLHLRCQAGYKPNAAEAGIPQKLWTLGL